MTIRLRTAVPADREIVVEFIHQLNVFEAGLVEDRKQDYGAAKSYYGELLQRVSRSSGRIVLAMSGNEVVGVMGFSFDEDAAYISDKVRCHGTVTDLIVSAEWRGQGIGQLLLNEAERLTREAGYKRILIGVLDKNEKAERTYRAFGFEPYVKLLVKDL